MRTLARVRRLAVALLAAVGIVTLAAGPALADGAHGQGAPVYLALGDSVPFGFYNAPYDQVTQPQLYAHFYSDPSRFRSYTDVVAADRHLKLVNASCPGETTGSFIDTTTDVFRCEGSNGYRTHFPLHVQYPGSQLAFAEEVLKTTPNVRLVTVQLGANDLFLCQATTADQCASPAEVQATAAKAARNLDQILKALRATGYRGQVDVVDYYSLNYADPVQTAPIQALNRAIDTTALAHHDTVVSGFSAFLPIACAQGGGDSRKAGLVRPAPDVHPTPFGHRVLATAVERTTPVEPVGNS